MLKAPNQKLAVKHKNQALFFVSNIMLADCFALRNPPLRQAQNR